MAVARSSAGHVSSRSSVVIGDVDERLSRVRTLRRIWPMLTRATVPFGLPHAPRIPVCSLSAPAQDNILLMRTTW